ncbi:MAG TPA: hypothetical protein DHV62_06785 [Elusimicrobia bacterium]|nr:hypothetical protein [Elusimicrobiota bacterium]
MQNLEEKIRTILEKLVGYYPECSISGREMSPKEWRNEISQSTTEIIKLMKLDREKLEIIIKSQELHSGLDFTPEDKCIMIKPKIFADAMIQEQEKGEL